jgi:AcrR family transcriptional regulator
MGELKGRSSTRERLLEAAASIVQREGVLALTLEAVAARARVSKGGLLYHFPTKEALVRALLEYHLDQFEQALARGSEPFVVAYGRQDTTPSSLALFRGMLAAFALDPELLALVRERYRHWLAQLPAQIDALVAMLAADGLFLWAVLGIDVPDHQLALVRQRLVQLAASAVAAGKGT